MRGAFEDDVGAGEEDAESTDTFIDHEERTGLTASEIFMKRRVVRGNILDEKTIVLVKGPGNKIPGEIVESVILNDGSWTKEKFEKNKR